MKSKKKSNLISKFFQFVRNNYIPIIIFCFFAISYLLLTLVKHYSFLTGYDLTIIDQAIWKYSQFKNPISTTHVYFDAPIYVDHLEIILILFSPLYWIFDSVVTLIILQVAGVISSGVAVYLIAKKYKLRNFVSYSILVSYLSFFGLQFALWSDVHSLVFGVTFLSWFLYFLETKKTRLTLIFLILSIISKEDIALLTLLISAVYFIFHRTKISLLSCFISFLYLFIVFFIYFPNVLPTGYRFANQNGLLGDLNPWYLIDSLDKQKTILYSLGWFGFLPLLAPLYTLPFFGDLAHYFVVGKGVIRTEDIFLHYRSSVGLLLVWPTIIVISKFKKLNSIPIGIYLLICACALQYHLHLPLSYLTKSWFWNIPAESKSINYLINKIPDNASVVTHINIAAHIAHRDQLYTLFPDLRDFPVDNSPCGTKTCRWFRVGGNPQLLIVDEGSTWNSLHYLGSRDDFFKGIENLRKNGNIQLIEKRGTTSLYKIIKKI